MTAAALTGLDHPMASTHISELGRTVEAGSGQALSALAGAAPTASNARRTSLLVAALSWTYAIGIVVAFESAAVPTAEIDALAPWITAPLQIATLILGLYLLSRPAVVPERQRGVWWLVFAFTAVNLLASVVWNTVPRGPTEQLRIPEALYIADYWILLAAFAALFVRLEGSFKSARVWLDGASMMAVQLVTLWSFFLAPMLPYGALHRVSLAMLVAEPVSLTALLTMTALVCMQLPNFRGRPGVVLLVGAVLALVAWEMNWMGSWVMNYELASPYYNMGDVLCFACIVSAAATMQWHLPQPEPVNPERQAYSFLPVLAVLVAIGLVAGTLATTPRWDAWILVGLVALCAQLLITRQLSVRKELRALNHLLATREADARLTELVRRSGDLIMVVDGNGVVSFASPAAELLLSLPASKVQGLAVAGLFGSSHESSVRQLLDCAVAGAESPEAIQLLVERQPGSARAFKVSASNQLRNPVIRGIVLTVHDVTGQRALEREVLDVATRERVRLCADIHDGLGQDLTGIALLLHAAAATPDADPISQRRRLDSIVEHVNRTIGAARDLARGLSPLHVVRGSLGGALRRMAQDTSIQLPIILDIDGDFDDRLIGDYAADHLYRIAQEAVTNALRHSNGKRIDISLHASRGNLVLRVADDGKGLSRRSAEEAGLGMKLMEYRARMVGGTLDAASAGDAGTRVEVTMPLPATPVAGISQGVSGQRDPLDGAAAGGSTAT